MRLNDKITLLTGAGREIALRCGCAGDRDKWPVQVIRQPWPFILD